MDESSTVRKRGPHRMRFLVALVAVLLVLIIVALLHPLKGQPRHASELEGNMDETPDALSALLSRTPEQQRLPLLLRDAEDGGPGLRYAAVDALGTRRDPPVAGALEQAFTDSSSVVRQRAMELLPDVDLDRGMRMLLAGLRDEDTWIRQAAITQIVTRAAQRHSPKYRRTVPMLIQALDDPDPAVSVLAMGALRQVTGQSWYARKGASAEQKRAAIAQWQGWWNRTKTQWQVPPEYAETAPIHPTRSDPAPDFSFQDLDGHPIRLADQSGRITLVNFWGSWCPPCQSELPDLVQLNAAYRGRLDVIGVALGEQNGEEGLRRWCAAHGVVYRQALATPEVLEAYGNIEEVPVSVLIDPQQRVRYRWEGERDLATFRAAVDRLLQEPPTK